MASKITSMFHKNLSSSTSSSSSTKGDKCENCGIHPKYVEDGHVHPYCGRRCATEYKRTNQQYTSSSATRLNKSTTKFQPQVSSVKATQCSIRDCKNQGRPQFGGFCSSVHQQYAVRKNYVKACVRCGNLPQTSGDMCITCQRFQSATRLLELHYKDPKYQSIVSIFSSNWKARDQTPKVMKILEVSLSRKANNSYEAYRSYLERRAPPSELSTFHSSQCICDLGTKTPHQLCDIASCGLCSAVKSNFTKFAFGSTSNSGSLGSGVYSYTNSARADRHSTSCESSPYRAMILCSVLVGKSPNTRSVNDTQNERVFVKDADAIIPTHIILYSST